MKRDDSSRQGQDQGVEEVRTPFANSLPILQDEVADFEASKKEDVKGSTWKTYERTLGHFVEFLAEQEVQELGDIKTRHFRRFDAWLRKQGNKKTTRNKKLRQLKTVVQDWVIFFNDRGADREWERAIDRAKPAVSPEEASRAKERVPTDKAERVVSRRRFIAHQLLESRELRDAAVLGILVDAGPRKSEITGLDVDDFIGGERPRLKFVDRTETGTNLKNGWSHEREAHVSKETAESIMLYLEHGRPDLQDEYGRQPLFHSGGDNGNPLTRISKKTVEDISYGYTRPCELQGECSLGKSVDDCPHTSNTQARGCPESDRPHAWRGTAANIMYYERGMPKDRVSDRMGLSVKILEKHYLEDPREEDLNDEWQAYFGDEDVTEAPQSSESQAAMTIENSDRSRSSLAEELSRLSDLHEDGNLTEEEYVAAKEMLLG